MLVRPLLVLSRMESSGEPRVADERVVRVRRRHRLFAVPSGLLLFVCMFLPLVENCGEPVYPYQAPLVCVPYVIGLVVGLRALLDAPLCLAALRGARARAVVALAFWLLATAWFGLWAFSGDGMIGAALSLACSGWLAFGAIVRLSDLRAAAAGNHPDLPRAQVGAVRPRVALPVMALFVAMLVTFAAACACWPSEVRPRPASAMDVDIDLKGLYGC